MCKRERFFFFYMSGIRNQTEPPRPEMQGTKTNSVREGLKTAKAERKKAKTPNHKISCVSNMTIISLTAVV